VLGLKGKKGGPQDWSLLWAACGTDSDQPDQHDPQATQK
jgi:hypothetical protein